MEKRNKIIYWIATGLLSFGMLAQAFTQITATKDWKAVMAHIGYPPYFLYIIGVWKLLGVIAILIPGFKLLKEWAYAGFFFVMSGAIVSDLASGDGIVSVMGPFVVIVLIVLSWYFRPANRKLVMSQQLSFEKILTIGFITHS